jgi:signal transduction histidine kinase
VAAAASSYAPSVIDIAREGWRHIDDPRARWASVVWLALPFLVAVGVVLQRRHSSNPALDYLLVGILLLPCIAELLRLRFTFVPRVSGLVWTAWTAVTAACVLALVLRPTTLDVAPFFLVMATAQTALEGARWRGYAAFVISAGVMVAAEVSGNYDGSFIWVIGIALGLVSGIAIRSAVELLKELEAAQAGLAARAAADERQRIAREVHDVVAHSLTVTMLHVTGARMAVRRDPDEAVAALEQAEQLGRQSLAEVRRIVGLLQPLGSGTAPALPTAADLPALIEQFRAAGLGVGFSVDGDLDRVAPSSGLALYRIAQESLTNVTKHAPGAEADVRVTVHNGRAHLVVANEIARDGGAARAPKAGGGLGLPGMRERAASLGGALRAGDFGTDGAWRVEAELPTMAP